jgi:hypothetical protein
VLIHVKFNKIQGRKVFMTATLTDGSGTTLYSDATSLYILPRGGQEDLNRIQTVGSCHLTNIRMRVLVPWHSLFSMC